MNENRFSYKFQELSDVENMWFLIWSFWWFLKFLFEHFHRYFWIFLQHWTFYKLIFLTQSCCHRSQKSMKAFFSTFSIKLIQKQIFSYWTILLMNDFDFRLTNFDTIRENKTDGQLPITIKSSKFWGNSNQFCGSFGMQRNQNCLNKLSAADSRTNSKWNIWCWQP